MIFHIFDRWIDTLLGRCYPNCQVDSFTGERHGTYRNQVRPNVMKRNEVRRHLICERVHCTNHSANNLGSKLRILSWPLSKATCRKIIVAFGIRLPTLAVLQDRPQARLSRFVHPSSYTVLNAPGFKIKFMKWCVDNSTRRFLGRFTTSKIPSLLSITSPQSRGTSAASMIPGGAA